MTLSFRERDCRLGTERQGNRILSGSRGSNPRPSAWKAEWADALPHQIRQGNFRSKTGPAERALAGEGHQLTGQSVAHTEAHRHIERQIVALDLNFENASERLLGQEADVAERTAAGEHGMNAGH